MKQFVYGTALLLASLVIASNAGAHNTAHIWDSKQYNYYANNASFANLSGLPLTASEAEHWIKYASSVWQQRTGAWVSTRMIGTTSRECYDFGSTSTNKDGYNVVSSVPGCFEPAGATTNCYEAGFTPHWTSGWFHTGKLVEADVCISNAQPGSGGPDSWSVTPGVGDDVVGVLIHEFGHALGLDHSQDLNPPGPADVVMDFFSDEALRGLGRVPFGADQEQIRGLYGQISRSRYWRGWDGTSWTNASYIAGGDWQEPGATIATKSTSSTQYVVTAGVNLSGDRIYFRTSPLPLTSSSSWSSHYIAASSHQSPDLAWNLQTGSGTKAVAVWQWQRDHDGSACILSVYSSSNLFVSGTMRNFFNGNYCTMLRPAVSYDRKSGRFIMAYVFHDRNSSGSNHYVWTMSSPDGVNWSSPVPTSIQSVTSPGLVCNYGECMLNVGWFPSSGSKIPVVESYRLEIGTGGVVIEDSGVTSSQAVQYRSDAGLYYKSGFGWRWLTARQSHSVDSLASQGIGYIYFHTYGLNPPTLLNWNLVDDSYFPAAWASHPFLFDAYLIYNRY